MGLKYNPLLFSGFDFAPGAEAYQGYKQPVPTVGDLPINGNTGGDMRVTLDTDEAWLWDAEGNRWILVGFRESGEIGDTPNDQGYLLRVDDTDPIRVFKELVLEPADATHPGIVTTEDQEFTGNKTVHGLVTADGFDANSNPIVNVTDPIDPQDAATKNYVDSSIGAIDLTPYFKHDGSVQATGDFDLNSHKLINVTDPTVNQDAATKKYVDDTVDASIAADAANRTLSNLLAPTSINEDLIPQSGFANVVDLITVAQTQGPSLQSGDNGRATKITMAQDMGLARVKIQWRVFSTGGTYQIFIRADDNGGSIPGTVLATSSTFAPPSTTGGLVDVFFDFPTPFALSNGTAYWISIEVAVPGGNVSIGCTNSLPNAAAERVGGVTWISSGNRMGFELDEFLLKTLGTSSDRWGALYTNDFEVSDGLVSAKDNLIQDVQDPTAAQDAATKNYVDTVAGDYLPLSGGTMAGDIDMDGYSLNNAANVVSSSVEVTGNLQVDNGATIDMGGNVVGNLSDPVNSQDAATQNYVDTNLANYLPLTGGTMSGDIDMGGGNSITNVVNSDIQSLEIVSSLAVDNGATVDMGSNPVTNVTDPSNPQDAATKNYVDTQIANTAATWKKETITLTGTDITNGYIDLTQVAKTDSIDLLVKGGGIQIEGATEDYTVSYTGGTGSKTRITWINTLATSLVSGDKLVVKYQY